MARLSPEFHGASRGTVLAIATDYLKWFGKTQQTVALSRKRVLQNLRKSPYLDTLMRAEEKVELGGVSDADVDCCAGRNGARFAGLLFLIGAEQPGQGLTLF